VFNETAYSNSYAWAPSVGLSGLSDLAGSSGGFVPTIIGTGGSIGGGIISGILAGAGHGAIAGPIGAGIGLLTGIIAGIFAAHRAKVQREDEISNAWAQSGPQAIDAVMTAYHQGQISGPEAAQAFDQIEAQFRQMTTPITKYNGQFGAFPNPDGPRPPNNCNWACGTYLDLHQQLLSLKGQLNMSAGAGGAGGLSLGGLTSDPVMLLGLGVLAFMLFK